MSVMKSCNIKATKCDAWMTICDSKHFMAEHQYVIKTNTRVINDLAEILVKWLFLIDQWRNSHITRLDRVNAKQILTKQYEYAMILSFIFN